MEIPIFNGTDVVSLSCVSDRGFSFHFPWMTPVLLSENPILQYDLLFKGCGVNSNFSVLQLKQPKASKFLQVTIHSVCFNRPRD